jgi:hypothetical protein
MIQLKQTEKTVVSQFVIPTKEEFTIKCFVSQHDKTN